MRATINQQDETWDLDVLVMEITINSFNFKKLESERDAYFKFTRNVSSSTSRDEFLTIINEGLNKLQEVIPQASLRFTRNLSVNDRYLYESTYRKLLEDMDSINEILRDSLIETISGKHSDLLPKEFAELEWQRWKFIIKDSIAALKEVPSVKGLKSFIESRNSKFPFLHKIKMKISKLYRSSNKTLEVLNMTGEDFISFLETQTKLTEYDS